jgi:hypothetical protein
LLGVDGDGVLDLDAEVVQGSALDRVLEADLLDLLDDSVGRSGAGLGHVGPSWVR